MNEVEEKNMGSRPDNKFDHLKKHYASMSLASFISHFPKKTKQEKNFQDYVFSSVLNIKTLNKVTGKIVDKPAVEIKILLDKILYKKK